MPRLHSRARLVLIMAGALAIVVVLLSIARDRDEPPAPAATLDAGEVSSEALMEGGLDLLYRRGDPQAAAIVFGDVLKKNPTHYGAHFQLAMALDRSGRPAEARTVWERVLQLAETSSDEGTAATARDRLAQPDTVSTEAIMAAGLDLLYTRGDPAAAVERFREVLARHPDHYGAHFQLAMALDSAGRPAEATPWWEKVLQMAESTSDQPTAETARARLRQVP